MDNRIIHIIEGVFDESFDYLCNLQNRYGFNTTILTFYRDCDHDEEIEDALCHQGAGGRMYTITRPLGHNDPNIDYNDAVIEDINAHIYMSYEQLYQLMIECRMNLDDLMKSMKFTIRHELGHILYYRNRFIGKTIREWNEHAVEQDNGYKHAKKLRKNASFESRLNWYIYYNTELPYEKAANDAVGITVQDIIDDYYRTHRP